MQGAAGLAADGVLLFHLAFILFAVFGAIGVWCRPRLAWLHLPALAWAGGIMIVGGICPLTPIENRLRLAGERDAYAGGFIDHYIVPVIYPPGLTHAEQLAGAGLLFGCNAVLYTLAWRRWRASR